MNQKIAKSAGITIVIFLVLTSFLGGYGMFLHHSRKQLTTNNEKPNTNKEKFFDNKLWFYTDDGELIGNYSCVTTDCDIAKNKVTDSDYKDSYLPSEDYIKVIQKRYAFINDEVTFLYDIKTKTAYKASPYKEVKDYGYGLLNDLVIVSNMDGYYGVLSLKNMPFMLIPFDEKYEFIGLSPSVITNNVLSSDYFLTLKDKRWDVIDTNEAVLTENITDPIVDFNGEFLILEKNKESYVLTDYNNNDKLSEEFKSLSFTGKYLNCTTHDNTFYVYDVKENKQISRTYSLEDGEETSSVIEDKKLKVYVGPSLKETINLS